MDRNNVFGLDVVGWNTEEGRGKREEGRGKREEESVTYHLTLTNSQ